MADEGSRKRGLDAAENSDEDEEDDMIGPMPAPPPKSKKKRGKCDIKHYCKSLSLHISYSSEIIPGIHGSWSCLSYLLCDLP